ncbi:MAG TPA: DUF302 domain-containing protein [bacterium]|nr:DUF302 domain-containing protein [bacterium]
MTYYMSKMVSGTFDEAVEKVKASLIAEGFGIITEIDVKATLKTKLDVDFRPYKILGACNPQFAYRALTAEDKIGTMLPCNVVVQQVSAGEVEIAAIDPVASMKAVENPQLQEIAHTIRAKLKSAVDSL